MHPTLLRFSLACAVAVPLAYFGAQVLGAAFYPGFSVLRDVASLLGSDRSTAPALFNTAPHFFDQRGVALISLLAAPGLGWGVAWARSARLARRGQRAAGRGVCG